MFSRLFSFFGNFAFFRLMAHYIYNYPERVIEVEYLVIGQGLGIENDSGGGR